MECSCRDRCCETSNILSVMRLCSLLSRDTQTLFYKLSIHPFLESTAIKWCNIPVHLGNKLERTQRKTATIVLALVRGSTKVMREFCHLWVGQRCPLVFSFPCQVWFFAVKKLPLHMFQLQDCFSCLIVALIVTACKKHNSLQHPYHRHQLIKVLLCSSAVQFLTPCETLLSLHLNIKGIH